MRRIRAAACAAAVSLGLLFAGAAAGQSNRFCAGERSALPPEDSAQEAGDLSLEHFVHQPASIAFCSYGAWAEQCADYPTAHAIYDRCITAGYAGAMLAKARLYEDGLGVPRDLAKATELLRRVAMSGDSGYATLGKLLYASALYLGKGVRRDEAEARKWFQAAADAGDPDAREFLATGSHTGQRDVRGDGIKAEAARE